MIRRAAAVTALALAAVSCGADDDDATDPAASDTATAETSDTTAPETSAADAAATTEAATTESDGADRTNAAGGDPEATPVTLSRTIYGQVLALDGFILYGFTMDERGSGESSCTDDCLAAWPPVPGDTPVHEDVTAEVSTIVRDDGFEQLVVAGWPVYFYAGDQPGTTNGQNVDGAWFVVDAEGELVMTEQVTEGY